MKRFDTRGEKIFYFCNYIVLGLLGLIALFPFYLVTIRAIAPTSDYILRDIVLYPSKLTLEYFNLLFNDPATKIFVAYKNTIFITVVGTALNMFMTVLTAYPLAERGLPFRSQITFFFLIPMFISGGLIPSYILFSKLHLLNTLWVLIVPGVISIGNLLLMRNFLMQLPEELIEAAVIDGCNKMQTIWFVVVPLSKAAMATIGLFYATAHWAEYGGALYFISPARQDLLVLQVFLTNMIQSNVTVPGEMLQDGFRPSPEGLKAAATLAVTVPILCVYPFVQKYFVKGMIVGSLKG